jgi:hypothetical protein
MGPFLGLVQMRNWQRLIPQLPNNALVFGTNEPYVF